MEDVTRYHDHGEPYLAHSNFDTSGLSEMIHGRGDIRGEQVPYTDINRMDIILVTMIKTIDYNTAIQHTGFLDGDFER